jgi:hypothetical protein
MPMLKVGDKFTFTNPRKAHKAIWVVNRVANDRYYTGAYYSDGPFIGNYVSLTLSIDSYFEKGFYTLVSSSIQIGI